MPKVIRVTMKDGKVYHVGKKQGEKMFFTWDEYEVNMTHYLVLLLSKKWGGGFAEVNVKTSHVASMDYVELP